MANLVRLNGQELLAQLDKGYVADMMLEAMGRTCTIPAHVLAQSVPLRFADSRPDTPSRKTMRIKCHINSEMNNVDMTRNVQHH